MINWDTLKRKPKHKNFMLNYDYHLKVFYKDVDQMGIVYYSRYFEYFEAARTEMLAKIGLDYDKVEANGAMLPVIESHAEYQKGAKFGQNLLVRTSIQEMPKVKLKFEYQIYLADSEEKLMKGHTIHAFTNLTGKPIRIPKYISKILKDKMESTHEA